jgi:hypothetical protein
LKKKKKKKKETYLAYLSAQWPSSPPSPSPQQPTPAFPLCVFFSPADAPAPPVSLFLFSFLPSPSSASPDQAPPRSPPRPAVSLPLPTRPSRPIKAVNPRIQTRPFSPSPFLPEMPAAINGKSPAAAPPRSPSSLPSHLFKPSSSFRTSLSQPHYTRSRAQSIASTQRHRLCPPERRPILCRRRPSSPARLLRIQARLTPLHAVSNFPRPFPFLLVLIVAHASSPERPRRPLPAPAIVGARVSPLSPLSRAHVTPLRNALAWGRFGGQEHCPGATPASRRRAGHLSGARAAVTRTRMILAIRSLADGQD